MSYDPHRKQRRARFLGRQAKNPYTDTGGGGDQSGNELKKSCAFALAMCVIIPLLALFTFLAIIGMIARVIPEITEHVTR